ncbi:MAG: tyrosine-type recombinase/integrase [Acidimicrobiales bacterium]
MPDGPPAEAAALLSLPAPDESWTPASEIRRRLAAVAGDNPELQRLVEVSARLAANSRARNTKASYQQHWATFERFCDAVGLQATPPVSAEVVSLFVAFLTVYRRVDRNTGERIETGRPLTHGYLRQAVAAIGYRHTVAGQPDPTGDPTIAVLLEGYGKTYGTATNGKDPLRGIQLGTICLTLSQPAATATRDLALSLLGTDGDLGLGPGQLASLDRAKVQPPAGPLDPLVLLLTRRGGPALHPIEVWPNGLADICPVTATTALRATIAPDAPMFTGDSGRLTLEGVVWIVTSLTRRAGIQPTTVDRRLPRLDATERLTVAVALGQPSDDDVRDRAILTALYWGCFRGEELASTRRHQLRFVDQGIEWTLPRAKNDQHGQGHMRGVPRSPDPWICPVSAITDWIGRLERLRGRILRPDDPVFPALNRKGAYTTPISRESVSDIVKNAATRAGLAGDYGSHSPRAGFATDALDDGATREQVQTYGGWRNHKSLDSYYRRTNTWGSTNPASRLTRLED